MYVYTYIYSSGSQPFPTHGPLDKLCLSSRPTTNLFHTPFRHFPGEDSDNHFLVISEKIPKLSQIHCIFQGQAHNSQPWSRPTRQMSAAHQWAAAHRLRTADIQTCIHTHTYLYTHTYIQFVYITHTCIHMLRLYFVSQNRRVVVGAGQGFA